MLNAPKHYTGWAGFDREGKPCAMTGTPQDTLEVMVGAAKNWAGMRGIPNRDEGIFAIAYETEDRDVPGLIDKICESMCVLFCAQGFRSEPRENFLNHELVQSRLEGMYEYFRANGMEVQKMTNAQYPIVVMRSKHAANLVAA